MKAQPCSTLTVQPSLGNAEPPGVASTPCEKLRVRVSTGRSTARSALAPQAGEVRPSSAKPGAPQEHPEGAGDRESHHSASCRGT